MSDYDAERGMVGEHRFPIIQGRSYITQADIEEHTGDLSDYTISNVIGIRGNGLSFVVYGYRPETTVERLDRLRKVHLAEARRLKREIESL